MRGVTPPPRPIDRCRCIGRRIVRSRIGSGIIRSSQCTGDDPTGDRWCPPTTITSPTATVVTIATPTTTAMMTLRLRYAGGANHDSRAQSDDSFFHWVNISDFASNTILTFDSYLVSANKILFFKLIHGLPRPAKRHHSQRTAIQTGSWIDGGSSRKRPPSGGSPDAFGWLLLRSRTAPPRKTRDAGEPHSGAQFVAAIGSEESASRQVGLRDNN